MSKKARCIYFSLEIICLCLIWIGVNAGWNIQVIRTIMYSAILINTAVTAYYYRIDDKRKREKMIAYRLFMTAAADFFMTFSSNDGWFLEGVILFCLVQCICAQYLKHRCRRHLVRAGIFMVLLVIVQYVGLLTVSNFLAQSFFCVKARN